MNKSTLTGAVATVGLTVVMLAAPIAAGARAPLKQACTHAAYQAPPGAFAQGECVMAANHEAAPGDRRGAAVCSPCTFSVFGFEPQPLAAEAQ